MKMSAKRFRTKAVDETRYKSYIQRTAVRLLASGIINKRRSAHFALPLLPLESSNSTLNFTQSTQFSYCRWSRVATCSGLYRQIWIYLLTAIGLTPGGSSTVHIYTQRMHRTTQLTLRRLMSYIYIWSTHS